MTITIYAIMITLLKIPREILCIEYMLIAVRKEFGAIGSLLMIAKKLNSI